MLKLAVYVQTFLGRLEHQLERQEGQTMAEYAVILTLIAAAVITALTLLRNQILGVLNAVADAI
jgi:Flp pilus assembly pilin Flp